MMAFERIEPFGALHEEYMHGTAIAANLNIHRDPAKSPPLSAVDVMVSLGKAAGRGEEKPILLDDPKAQSMLIKALFNSPKREVA